MSLVAIIWSMAASACWTLAVVHLLTWCRNRTLRANLAFALAALAVGGVAVAEVLMMHAETPAQFVAVFRWAQVPIFVLLAALVAFVQFRFRTGRFWLGWCAVGLRFVSLVVSFSHGATHALREIKLLRQVEFLGEPVSVIADGVVSPWGRVGELSSLCLLVYVGEASIRLWRVGGVDDRRRALLVGGSITFFIVAAAGFSALINHQLIQAPHVVSLPFLAIVFAMAYELSWEANRAESLSAELRERDELMSLATTAAGIGVWIWKTDSNDVLGSERWNQLFGFPPGAKVSLDAVFARMHPNDAARVDKEVRLALERGGDYSVEFRVSSPNGMHRWIAARGAVRLEKRGKPARMLGTAIDITERKESELELQQRRSELAHLSRVNMLGELAGSLAHELNQPLTAILSNAQAAQRFLARGLDQAGELREILTDIVAEDKRAGEVIHRLRQLLKKGEVQHGPLKLNEVVQEVLKLARTDLVSHGVVVQVELEPELPVIQGDNVQLQQVLLNLVINACDAMAGSTPEERQLTIQTARSGTDAVRVSVTDNGPGIGPDKLERVFEPFYSTKAQGLGLGLAVCRTIVRAHDGQLWAVNNTGRGATLHFTLPVTPANSHSHQTTSVSI